MASQPTVYCSLADVLALVSTDQQARLATDQGAVPIGTGNGYAKTFKTPFTGSTSIKTQVGGVDTPNTLSPGTGRDGVDQVVFAAPPAMDALVTGAANIGAVNTAIVYLCMTLAADEIRRYLSRYDSANLPSDCLAVIKSAAVFYTRWFLRERKNMNDYPPILAQKKTIDDWLMSVATGKIALPASAPIAEAVITGPTPVYSEPSVFEPPGSNASRGSFWW